MSTRLDYGLEWDRDRLMPLAASIRRFYWPFSVFLLLPLVLFILIFKTRMDRDCKLAFVAHTVILVIFDIYNGLFYQLYTLLPFPVFVCTGILCDEHHSPRTLLTILAFWTIALCIPYLFVMMRIHQKILEEDSPLKLSCSSQMLLMLLLTFVLASNVYGFGAWSVESPEKHQIMEIPSLRWARNQSRNFLVLGKEHGDIGLFGREMYILLFSILVCFSFNAATTYHAVFRVGKQKFRTAQRSRTYELQMRFMLCMSIQEFLTSILFIIPMAGLFIFMATPIATVTPDTLFGLLRFTLIVMYNSCSFGHAMPFLCKSTWVIQTVRRFTLVPQSSNTLVNAFSSSVNSISIKP